MTDLPDSFLVLGDLGGDRYIVRMFIGDQTFDQEFDDVALDALAGTVEVRMVELAATPDPSLLVESSRPLIDPGHAVVLPEAT